ncbi:FtsK/SpoIIIE domain-containing protein [Streptomyces sp. 1-11]|uniref:FtsK/SpoIIIE domain-containing protein n=1 Tax=Streptomyces sp. 1-11 TaxID=2590549 RepID=UPI00117D80D7|nr:FtsK/SpoIIIE domain-containing protein [Streptomyces sp. 1-11]
MSGKQAASDDMYAQAAGGIGALAIAAGTLAAIKDKLGLSWPATLLLTAGALVALGYAAWKAKTTLKRLWGREPKAAAKALAGTAAQQARQAVTLQADGTLAPAETDAPAHPELTAALRTAGAISRDQIIKLDEATVTDMPTGAVYDFLMPQGRTYEDVEKRLGTVAGMFHVTRLHMTLERSRDNERRVKLLKLHEPPFTRPFPAPTRGEIETFAGIPLGHDVTGQLIGVPTFDKASLLVAGMTQMGKTTLINGLITCLLIAYGDFDLYLLDGKFCGLTRFEPIATRYESSDDPAVFWSMVRELNQLSDSRYAQIKEAIRNRKPVPTFKPVIFIVDEAADFFASGGNNEEKDQAKQIVNDTRSLVSKSLESGISTVLMTQRPSANAIPVEVRDQFLYRLCLYVASAGTAKVALGDTYFETIAPINPALLDPDIKGQGVLFTKGRSTLIRGFNFEDKFIWDVVDEIESRHKKAVEAAPDSPLKQAVDLLRDKGVEFMCTADLAPALGILEGSPVTQGRKLSALLGVTSGKDDKGVRGYHLADLVAALKSAL